MQCTTQHKMSPGIRDGGRARQPAMPEESRSGRAKAGSEAAQGSAVLKSKETVLGWLRRKAGLQYVVILRLVLYSK